MEVFDDGCIHVHDSWNMWGRVCLKFVGVCNEFNSSIMIQMKLILTTAEEVSRDLGPELKK